MLFRPCVWTCQSISSEVSPRVGVFVLDLLCSIWLFLQVCGFSSPSSGAHSTLSELTPDSSSPQFLPVASPFPPPSRGLFDGVIRPTLWCKFGSSSSSSIRTHMENDSHRRIQREGMIGIISMPRACPLPPRGIFSRTAARNTQGILTNNLHLPTQLGPKEAEFRTRSISGELSESEDGVGVKVNLSNHESLNWHFFVSCRALHPPFPSKDF